MKSEKNKFICDILVYLCNQQGWVEDEGHAKWLPKFPWHRSDSMRTCLQGTQSSILPFIFTICLTAYEMGIILSLGQRCTRSCLNKHLPQSLPLVRPSLPISCWAASSQTGDNTLSEALCAVLCKPSQEATAGSTSVHPRTGSAEAKGKAPTQSTHRTPIHMGA